MKNKFYELTGSEYHPSVTRGLKPFGSDNVTDLLREIVAFE